MKKIVMIALALLTSSLYAEDSLRVNGAKVIGVRPGNPVHHYVAVVGEGPLEISVTDLPKGLSFNSETRLITGSVAQKGEYQAMIKVKNKTGKSVSRKLTIKVGEKIQLTPPMGFNSWYCFSESVSDAHIRMVADGFVKRGLRDHGWQFVNIDDCWQGVRGGELNAIQPNERFPDMKKLCDYVHSKGLKIGIYSSPWISTYAGFIGGSSDGGDEKSVYIPEEKRIQKNQVFGRWPGLHKRKVDREGREWLFDRDVKQWVIWGFDYVKVDWKPNDVPTTKKIAECLQTCGRDIVLSLSNAAPIKNAEGLSQYAQLWRTSGDIHDSWGSISGIGFRQNTNWAKFQSPGAFNDPDMLQIGAIGTPNTQNVKYRLSKLTFEEQKTQFSLWAIMGSPLFLSCDIAQMDDATYSIVTNDEVIDVNQDPLCIQAVPKNIGKDLLRYQKPLEDGSMVVGYFNLSNNPQTVTIDFSQGNALWQKGKSVTKDEVISLPAHGCELFRIPASK